MYLQHFGLREFPFSLTPDTSFAFESGSQQRALADVLVAQSIGEGFIKVVGEVGTGKTLLCRRLLAGLPADALSAYIPNPALTPRALLLALVLELGADAPPRATEYELRSRLERVLAEHAEAGRSVVVLIDEAQTMPHASLEALRLISNLETEKRKLLQLVLFGQPELDRRLARPEARQLRQRIAFSVRLGPMREDEVPAYLEHRMRVAGPVDRSVFAPGAARMIAWASRGVPRVVNVLANKSLMLAYGRGAARVRAREAWLAARDTADARAPALFAMPVWVGRPLLAALRGI